MFLKCFRALAALTILTFLISPVMGHDIWLYAEDFSLTRGQRLVIHQVSGHDMQEGMEFELLLDMTPRFMMHTQEGQTDLLAGLGRTRRVISPVLDTIAAFDGPALITMDHSFIYTQWNSNEFAGYLYHEGLTAELGGTFPEKKVYSERYARSFKCLVQSGDGPGDAYRQLVGQKLEIILLQNPYTLDVGDRLEFQVYFDGQPVANQLVTALSRNEDKDLTEIELLTDQNGKASFTLAHDGSWLLRSIRLFECADRTTDWESHWTSFTFALD